MNNQIFPCFWFDGQAKNAADFYCTLFKNSKITADTPMVVTFELDGFKLMGLNGGPMFQINPSISLFATCETVADVNALWDKLIDGGSALMTIDKYPWSERYGWLKDKFGVTWQVSLVNRPEDKARIAPSMLFTGNRFGMTEAAINFYSDVFKTATTDVLFHYPEGDANAGKVLYAEFSLNETKLIAMDGPGNHDYTFNEAVSFVVNCETQNEIDYYWNKLTEGGKESRCGWLVDKFGISWQVVPTIIGKLMSDNDRAGRVMQDIMKMNKIDISTLINA